MAKRNAKTFTDADDALLGDLGVEVKAERAATYTPKEERIIAGYEEIQRFVETHGRPPTHGDQRDIFERLYAVRLDRIRASDECRAVLKSFDTGHLLDSVAESPDAYAVDDTDDALLAALGVDAEAGPDITDLTHVRPRAEIRAAEEVAQRAACEDFEAFRPVFERVQQQIKDGERRTAPYQNNNEMTAGDLFILDGQKVLIATMGEPFEAEYGRTDRRLRVIYDNATESDLLMRSLQRALYKDEAGRRILPADSEPPPLFSDTDEEDDTQSGYVYVLRSCSDDPFIAENRDAIHKLGVTGGDVKKRVANARKDPTFLLADVEIVQTWRLSNVNRHGLERLLHQFFAAARLDVKLLDRFGIGVEPREWFLVPFAVIQESVELLKSGAIEHHRYDAKSARIVKS